jgi:thiol-disulfide isomerase/thioredoxin
MKTLVILSVLLFSIPGFTSGQNPEVLNFNQLEQRLNLRNDTTYVVNFWATWCVPCIKEMPYFQQIHNNFSGKKVKVLLVSLDFVKQIESRLIPFIEKNKLTPEVVVLNDPDANAWINKVSPDWSGALPATLFFNRNFRAFYEKSFEYEELETIINQNLIHP